MKKIELDELRTISSTNTQTRRLGYLIQLCKIVDNDELPFRLLQTDIESWALENNHFLEAYFSNKGILTSSHQSYGSQRYINLAEDLSLIVAISGYFRPTKIGHLVTSLNQQKNTNPFLLSSEIVLLLIFQLLMHDADYILEILELTNSLHNQKSIQDAFQKSVIQRLMVMENMDSNFRVRHEIVKRKQAIQSWKKPKSYSEHIVMPRLHWLLDLNILDRKSYEASKTFKLNNIGRKLFNSFVTIDGERIINRRWCENNFFACWGNAHYQNLKEWCRLEKKVQLELLNKYLLMAYRSFGSKVFRRISAYQFILYLIINMMFGHKILLTFDDAKEILSTRYKNSLISSFQWSNRDNDGYIIIEN